MLRFSGSESVIGLNPYMSVAGGIKLPLAVWNVIGRLVKMFRLSFPPVCRISPMLFGWLLCPLVLCPLPVGRRVYIAFWLLMADCQPAGPAAWLGLANCCAAVTAGLRTTVDGRRGLGPGWEGRTTSGTGLRLYWDWEGCL